MKIIQNMKIRHKLIAIIMLTCFVSLLLAGTIFIVYNYSSSRKSMVRNLLTQAEMIAENCKAAVIFDDPKDAEETLQTLHYQPSIVHACLYTIDGNDFASYYRQDAERGANPSRIFEDFSRFENGSFSVFKSIIVNDKNIGSVYLQSDLQPLYSALTRNICMVVSVLLCASLLAYLLSVKLQGVISGPILSLAKTAQKVSENKEYSVRAEKQGNDEIGVLIESFNDM